MSGTADEEGVRFPGGAMLTVENVGGIDRTAVEFAEGVTVLEGRNATNRSSLLQAVNGVLGGTMATLKSDADEGRVTLEMGEETYDRRYSRQGGGRVATDGEPFCDDETLIDSFVTLLGDNHARAAVERGDDLRDVIMRPVDTDEIERRIRAREEDLEEVKRTIETVEKRRSELPALEERRTQLETEIEELDDEIEECRAEVAEFEADVEVAEEADELVDELDDRRQSLSATQDDIEVTESEIAALREDVSDLDAELAETNDGPDASIDELDETLATLRERERSLTDTIESLLTIVEFNETVLAEDGEDLPGIEFDDENVAAELGPRSARGVVCWTCGSDVDYESIDERLDDLRDVVEEKRAERAELTTRIDDFAARRQELERLEARRADLEDRLDTARSKLDAREDRLGELVARADDLRDEIEELEEAVAETETLRNNSVLETYERLSDLQYERGQREQRLDDVVAEIDEIEELQDESTLAERHDELAADLAAERNRITNLETEAIEAFNTHMEEILVILEYENIERVWIERRERSGRGHGSDATFDLHVIREDESGSVYEDDVAHLSESERAVVGLIVALAGYLAHGVYEDVPFILLDSLETIDSDRIANLVEYFADYGTYLVVALLPEDADALPDKYDRVPSEALTG